MMYRGHIPKSKEEPEPTKDTAVSCVVTAFFHWSGCDADIVYALLLVYHHYRRLMNRSMTYGSEPRLVNQQPACHSFVSFGANCRQLDPLFSQ